MSRSSTPRAAASVAQPRGGLTSASALRSRSAIASSASAVLRRLSGSASNQLTHSAWIPSSALVASSQRKTLCLLLCLEGQLK